MTPRTFFCAVVGLSLLTATALAPAAQAQTAAEQYRAEMEARADQLRAQAEIRRCVLQNRANQLRGLPTVNCNAPAPTPTPVPPPAPPRDTTAPTIPARLTASATSCSEIQVSWSPSGDTGGSGLQGYDVYRDARFLMQVRAPFASFSDGNLAEAQSYSYQVAAFDGAGNRSSRSSAGSATTPSCAPAPGPGILGTVAGFGYPDELVFDAQSGIAIGLARDGLTIADLRDPARPRVAARVDLEYRETGVAIDGTLAYVVEDVQNASANLAVLDLSDPTRPLLVSRTLLPGGGGGGIALRGSLAYVGMGSGLVTVDLATPRSPLVLGMAATAVRLFQVDVGDGFILARKNPDGFAVFDARDPRRPAWVRDSGWPFDTLALAGRIGYGLTDFSLFVVDWSNLLQPRLIEQLTFPAADVAVLGDRLAFASFELDLMDATSLRVLEQVALPERGRRVAADGGLVVVTDGSGAFSVISVLP